MSPHLAHIVPTNLPSQPTPTKLTIKKISSLLGTSSWHGHTPGQPISLLGLVSAHGCALVCNWIPSHVLNAPSGATLSEHCWGLLLHPQRSSAEWLRFPKPARNEDSTRGLRLLTPAQENQTEWQRPALHHAILHMGTLRPSLFILCLLKGLLNKHLLNSNYMPDIFLVLGLMAENKTGKKKKKSLLWDCVAYILAEGDTE